MNYANVSECVDLVVASLKNPGTSLGKLIDLKRQFSKKIRWNLVPLTLRHHLTGLF